MNITPKARVAIIVALASVLLTGCSAADANGAGTTADPAPSTPSTEQTPPEQRKVKAVKVIDPSTIVVTPLSEDDSLYGTDFTVHVKDIVTPAKAACGYDDSLAFAQELAFENTWFLLYSVDSEVWIDADGDHYGTLGSRGATYEETFVGAGFAHIDPDAEPGYLTGTQQDAQSSVAGLWASCPEFGK